MHFIFQWYFSSLDYATNPLLSLNSILDDIANGTTYKLKDFLCCYRSNKKKKNI